jgi:type IV secretory pathway TrbL component
MNFTKTVAAIGIMASMALPALALENSGVPATTAAPTVVVVSPTTIACVGTAVNAREQAIGAAATKYTTAANASYSARATALAQAYTLTTKDAVRSAVKAAWSSFNSSMKSARGEWKTSRKTAWDAFRTAQKACKAPSSLSDTSSSKSEESGL